MCGNNFEDDTLDRARFFRRSCQQWHSDFSRQPQKNWRIAGLVVVCLGLFLGHGAMVQKVSRAAFPHEKTSGPGDKSGPLARGCLSQVRSIDRVKRFCVDTSVEFAIAVGLAVTQARPTNDCVADSSVLCGLCDRAIGAEDLSTRSGLFDHPAGSGVSVLDCCIAHLSFPLAESPAFVVVSQSL